MRLLGGILHVALALSTTSEAFDVREATIDGIHNALYTRLTTCREVVSAYIARIEQLNPTINAIIGLNPDALSLADELDSRLASGNATGLLFCIPILLKDNYDATPMNTTGACLDMAGNKPTVDAPSVKAFKDAGAIILGKTNLHELALEGLSVSSYGGQTINPYDHTRTPGGSSGGTGAVIAANFAVFGTGTDTVNSLRSPAASNSLFSFRPTRGLLSRAGVVPISVTQDTVGAIGRSPKDLAAALTVMSTMGYDPADNVTALIPPELVGKDYTVAVRGGSLKGVRLGLIQGFFNHTTTNETTPVNEAVTNMVSVLQGAGVKIINITESIYNATAISAALDVQAYEYRETLNAYLASPNLTGTRPASFGDIYSSGKFVVIPSQYNFINSSARSSTGNSTYFVAQRGITNLTAAVRATFQRHQLDALIYPEQKNLVVKLGAPSQSGRNGILAALTGCPVVVVPAGFSPPSDDAPVGIPIGMEIFGLPWSEDKLLNIAQHVSEIAPIRRMPTFANATVEVTAAYEEVPTITPNRGNIPAAYPVGKLSSS